MTDVDVFLAHYGVKGMKWGVSRAQIKDGVKKHGKKIAVGAGLAVAAVSIAAGSAYVSKSHTLNKVAADLLERDNDLVRKGANFAAEMNVFNRHNNTMSEVNAKALYDFLTKNTTANVPW